jgi:protein involved in polysaccharide export with SLBB domain
MRFSNSMISAAPSYMTAAKLIRRLSTEGPPDCRRAVLHIVRPSDAGARPGNFVTLPNQILDSNGNITVPYAGTIPAAGKTPSKFDKRSTKL